MLKDYYRSQTSIPEEHYICDDYLSEHILSCLRDPICLNIPNVFSRSSPAECKECSQVLCADCVSLVIKSDSKCPNCREYLQVRKMNRNLKQIASNLKLRCNLHHNGCKIALPLEELIHHESTCEYQSLECPKQCGQILIQKDLESHLRNECSQEYVICSFSNCKVRLLRGEMKKHEEICVHRTHNDVTPGKEKQPPVTGFVLAGDGSVIDCFDEELESEKRCMKSKIGNSRETRLINSIGCL